MQDAEGFAKHLRPGTASTLAEDGVFAWATNHPSKEICLREMLIPDQSFTQLQ